MSEDRALRKVRSRLDKALEADRADEALQCLAQLRSAEPENARWPHKQGDLLRKQDRIREAVQCYATAVGLYAEQGFLVRAIAMAKAVVVMDPSRIDILARVDPEAAQLLRSGKALPRRAVMLDEQPFAPLPPAPLPPGITALSIRPPVAPVAPLPPVVPRVPSLPAAAVAKPRTPGVPPVLKQAAQAVPPVLAAPAAPPRGGAGAGPREPARSRGIPPPFVPAGRGPRPENMAMPRPPAPPPAARRLPSPPPAAVSETRAAQAPGDKRDALLQLSMPPAMLELARRTPGGAEPLELDPRAPANETRFSNAPSRPSANDADESLFSELEFSERTAVPMLESVRPEPLPAEALAKLPLFPLFAELPKPALDRLVAGSELVELAHGAHVLRSGQTNAALFGIVAGSVDIVVPGQAFQLTLAEGDVFGEACLFDEDKSHADVTVIGNLLALRVPRAVLLEVAREHVPLTGLLLELLTRRLLGNLLQVSPLFHDFDARAKVELARLFEVRRAAPGTMLAVVGKKMDGLYISLTGNLRVNQPGAPERLAPPGSMFGQNAILEQTASQVDVIAQVDMILLRLPFAQLTKVAMQYPTVLARLAELSTSEVVRVTM